MKRETLFLKIAVILMGLPVIPMCLFLVPILANLAAKLFPAQAYLKYLVFLDMYTAAIPFYVALYQAFKLLSYIDENKAFSELSVTALKNIRNCALAIIGVYALGLPVFYLLAEAADAPGIILLGLVVIFASTVIAVFAAVLQTLLKNAIAIKSENDLTV